MDVITVVRIVVTVVCLLSFITFAILAFNKKNSATLDAVAQSILDDGVHDEMASERKS
jgi:hypothetical protein